MRSYLAVAHQIASRVNARPARLNWLAGVVSFTFDDFPKSSIAVGGRILENYGVRGTYFVCMDLAGTERNIGRMFDREDIYAAHSAGHEIACHTYTHLDCSASPEQSILAEIDDNAAALSSLLGGLAPTNFAYPYGRVSPAAKRVLGSRFVSCRGIREDINHGIIDLADLAAISIYSSVFDESKMRLLIDRNRSLGGWLIFYTHDIAKVPSPFGCTPKQLETAVACASQHATILPVREVVAHTRPLKTLSRALYKAIPRRIYNNIRRPLAKTARRARSSRTSTMPSRPW
jgi:peptidoglycan/xylan/chitin deacetylase (PgdA/CDA1 family)